jgi:hypothetical protein
METSIRILIKPAALLALCVFGGCATDPTLTEQNFGNSVRNMVRVQTYDPSTLDGNASDAIEPTDGQKTERTVEAYREATTGSTQSVGQEISINVGGQ